MAKAKAIDLLWDPKAEIIKMDQNSAKAKSIALPSVPKAEILKMDQYLA